MDFNSWASRRQGRGQQEPRLAQQPQRNQPVAAAPAPTLPPPPVGFAWSIQGGQYILVQLAPQPIHMAPARTTIVAPVRQPAGVAPFTPQSIHSGMPVGSPAGFVETCQLVKPGNRDTYAEFLATQPELVPDQGFNAEAGNPNPAVIAELRGLPEYQGQDGAVNPEAPLRSFTGGRPLINGSAPLSKGAA
jgi:hypothetical protein